MSASRARRTGGRLVAAAALAGLLISSGPGLLGTGSDGAQAATGPVAVKHVSSEAATKPASSWKTVRTEDFSGSSLPSGCGAYSGAYPGGASAWSSKDVRVSGGVLKLGLEQRTTAGQPYTSGGVGCWGWAQKYGRYEVRARIPSGTGIDSNFALWPSKAGGVASTGVELLAPGTETAYVTNGFGTESETAQVAGSYSSAFHTYVIEWAPKYLRITVDGREIYFSTRSYTGSRWFGMVVTSGDALSGVPDATTVLPASFQIDRVKVSSYTGVPPRAPAAAASRSRVAGIPTAVPTTVPPTADEKVPTDPATTAVGELEPTVATQSGPALAGGIWPWLLGGSLIAAFAALSLNHPRARRPFQT